MSVNKIGSEVGSQVSQKARSAVKTIKEFFDGPMTATEAKKLIKEADAHYKGISEKIDEAIHRVSIDNDTFLGRGVHNHTVKALGLKQRIAYNANQLYGQYSSVAEKSFGRFKPSEKSKKLYDIWTKDMAKVSDERLSTAAEEAQNPGFSRFYENLNGLYIKKQNLIVGGGNESLEHLTHVKYNPQNTKEYTAHIDNRMGKVREDIAKVDDKIVAWKKFRHLAPDSNEHFQKYSLKMPQEFTEAVKKEITPPDIPPSDLLKAYNGIF